MCIRVRSFLYYTVAGLVELPIRIAATFFELFEANTRYEVERRLRGIVLGLFKKKKNIRVGGCVRIEGLLNISIGDNVTIYDGVDLIAGRYGEIKIGSGSHVGRKCVINGLSRVIIGDNTYISSHVSVFTISNTPEGRVIKKDVFIGENVIIGMGANILPGVKIGNNATIGAGAVVVKDVEDGDVVVGVPARVVRSSL